MNIIYAMCVNQDSGTYIAFYSGAPKEVFFGNSNAEAVGLLIIAKGPVMVSKVVEIVTARQYHKA